MIEAVVIAGSCPLCQRRFDWSEIPPGAHGVTCPNCSVPVELERPPPPAPPPPAMMLVPTYPKPAPPPPGMEVARMDLAPAPPPVAIDGPFRTPGRAFTEHRADGVLTIELPHRRNGSAVNAGAVVWAGGCALVGVLMPVSVPMMLLLGGGPLATSVALRRRRQRLVIDPTNIVARGLKIPRAMVTHIFCVGVYQHGWRDVLWHVRVRSRHVDHGLLTTDSLDDANALASLLATELGLPTWVPPTPPVPPRA